MIYCCENCRFMRVRDKFYECHKNPPALYYLDDALNGYWPNVRPNDWCGCYDVGKQAEKVLRTRG